MKYQRAWRYLAVSNFVAHQLEDAGIERSRIDIVHDAVQEIPPGIWDPNAAAVALDSSDPGKCRNLVADAARRAGIPMIFSSDLPRDLARASMFVYLTRSEGLGSAAILALAMGIPVVAGRVEGLAEVFEDGVSGLYTMNDAESAAAAMRRVIDTPGLGLSLSEAGRRRAQTEFSGSRMLERTLAAYRQVLDD
jgi:glycosyltransferase involved in cell wall biosynthesis